MQNNEISKWIPKCGSHDHGVAVLKSRLPRGWSGEQRQRPRDTPGLWDSLENLGKVAKLVP
ncbi:hypothetical protein SBC1_02760 [Caballeronia sp. SBC1]|nr:hypothetical protein SBC1_02760 [Caballeronia sp. SBC1]